LSWVIDSSLLVKFVIDEPGSQEVLDQADNLIDSGVRLWTVDFAFVESLNALWKHATIHRDVDEDDVKKAAEDLQRLGEKLHVLRAIDLLEKIMRISLIDKISAYDSLFIAASEYIGGTLWTSDKKLHIIASRRIPSEYFRTNGQA
jgi:predicted nucleic acid-binding protein